MTYTYQNISDILKVPRSTIAERVKKLGIIPKRINPKFNKVYFNENQFKEIEKYFKEKWLKSTIKRTYKQKEVIIVDKFHINTITETYYIYPSKMNL